MVGDHAYECLFPEEIPVFTRGVRVEIEVVLDKLVIDRVSLEVSGG